MLTATEIRDKEIQINCYLCGKGKITIRQGDILLYSSHPLPTIVKHELEKYLLDKIKQFFSKYKLPTNKEINN